MLEGVVCEGFDDSVMLAPGSVMTGNHEMYKVFTPFKNAFIKRLKEALPECVAAPAVRGETIKELPELTFDYPQQPFDETLFPADEKAAIAQLRQFCKQDAASYDARRDFPAIEGTSACRPVWRWARYHRASVYIVCWRSSRRRWRAAQGPSG